MSSSAEPCYCSCSSCPDVCWRSNRNMTGKVDIKSNYTFDKCLVSRSAGRSHNHLSTAAETVKQTPAKPESRSQAKTLPVSSGLWREDVHSRERPPLHLEIVQTGKILENDYSGYEAQFHDNWDWLIPGIVVLLWRSSKAVKQKCLSTLIKEQQKDCFWISNSFRFIH